MNTFLPHSRISNTGIIVDLRLVKVVDKDKAKVVMVRGLLAHGSVDVHLYSYLTLTKMKVSGQLHAPVKLLPGTEPPITTE